MTAWLQREIILRPRQRGFHLITREVLDHIPEIGRFGVGIASIFIKHTSASLTLNENTDPTVRSDMDAFFRQAIPDETSYFQHTLEGPDDMPAHVRAALIGSSVTIPVSAGTLNLGTWQGLYLCEHRKRGGGRHLVVTIVGGQDQT